MIQKLDHDNGTTTCMSPSILFNVLSKCQARQAQDELKLHSFKRCLLGTGLMSLGDNAILEEIVVLGEGVCSVQILAPAGVVAWLYTIYLISLLHKNVYG